MEIEDEYLQGLYHLCFKRERINRRAFLKGNLAASLLIPLLGSCMEALPEEKPLELAPLPDGTLYHFDLFGDSRSGPKVFSSLSALSRSREQGAFCIHLGDMITSPDEGGQWAVFSELSKSLGRLLPILGNHDVKDESSMHNFRTVYPHATHSGYYAQQINNCFCILLNTEEIGSKGTIGDQQFDWLTDQLNSTEARLSGFIMIAMHRTMFPIGKHREEPVKNYEELHELFLLNRVAVVFAAHEHHYHHQKIDGIHYVTSGGAGSPLHYGDSPDSNLFFHFIQVAVLKDLLLLRSIDLLGKTRDEVEIFL